MADEIKKVDILFKSVTYGMYGDGTFSLVLLPLLAPVGKETIEEAQKREVISSVDCLNALTSIVKSGFTIRASVGKASGPRFDQPIVLG